MSGVFCVFVAFVVFWVRMWDRMSIEAIILLDLEAKYIPSVDLPPKCKFMHKPLLVISVNYVPFHLPQNIQYIDKNDLKVDRNRPKLTSCVHFGPLFCMKDFI